MFATIPGGVGRRHEPILENTSVRPLSRSALADGHRRFADITRVIRPITQHVDDAYAGKEIGAEGINGGLRGGGPGGRLDEAGKLRRSEWLTNRAVDLLSNEAKHFRDAEVGRQHLRVGDRGDLATGIETLRKSRHSGIRVGRNAGIVLVVILQREGVLGVDDPVEIADRLIGDEICGSWDESVFRKVDGRDVLPSFHGIEILAVGHFVLEHRQRDRADLVGTSTNGTVQRGEETVVGNRGEARSKRCRGSSRLRRLERHSAGFAFPLGVKSNGTVARPMPIS